MAKKLKLCQLCSSFAASNMRQHMWQCHFGEAFVVGRVAVAEARARAYDRLEGLRLLAFYGIQPQLNLNPTLPLERLPESPAAITMDADLAAEAADTVPATSNEASFSVSLQRGQRGEANEDGVSNDPPSEPTMNSNSHAAAVVSPAMAANRELVIPDIVTKPEGARTQLPHVTPYGRASHGSAERSLPTGTASVR
uniref:AP2/ERF domain-containing protein n=1 Tax=Macrostomum lignano TaxID=282301 RepID=A0A1I8GV58_9PLAT